MPFAPAPLTVEEVLDPAWLSAALSQGRDPVSVTAIDVIETLGPSALKIRFKASFAGEAPADLPAEMCIKGVFNPALAEYLKSGAQEGEANFYRLVAPLLTLRTPRALYSGVDAETRAGVTIMEDLIPQGARFLTALSAYTADQARRSLDQLARLHGGSWHFTPRDAPWIEEKLDFLHTGLRVTPSHLTELMQGERGDPLPETLRSGERIYAAIGALAERGRTLESCYVHGDAHAGNVYEIDGEIGLIDWQLIQRAHWSLDVAYHIGAALGVEDRRAHEQELLRHYLDRVVAHGGTPPAWEEAWRLYRESVAYGFFLWGITLRVDPAITREFVKRLGTATADHDSLELLGV